MAQRIALSLTEDYCSSWGVWEGVRELVQNFHDGCLGAGDCVPTLSWHHEGGRHEARDATGAILGTLTYDAEAHALKLINRCVGLQRKVLLLGSSHKAVTSDAIGQFGEGMKVGTLALLREGRLVTMRTQNERWDWLRLHDPAFGVRVLTVEVTPREQHPSEGGLEVSIEQSELEVSSADDTCTTLAPLSPDEWATFERRFLFLSPPADSFRCELGELLLDESLRGQLFVKGIWIANLQPDGIESGLNFRAMRLDRDRRAVLHTSDLESQAAGLWVRALDRRPELSMRLYELLAAAQPGADVKRVAEFLDKEQRPMAVQAMLDAFHAEHGASGSKLLLPLAHSDMSAMKFSLAELESRLQKRIVLVSPALLACLRRSGHVPTVEQLKDELEHAPTPPLPPVQPVAWAALEERSKEALRRAVGLANATGDPELEVGLIDVIDAAAVSLGADASASASVGALIGATDIYDAVSMPAPALEAVSKAAEASPRVEVPLTAFEVARAHAYLDGCVGMEATGTPPASASSCTVALLHRYLVSARKAYLRCPRVDRSLPPQSPWLPRPPRDVPSDDVRLSGAVATLLASESARLASEPVTHSSDSMVLTSEAVALLSAGPHSVGWAATETGRRELLLRDEVKCLEAASAAQQAEHLAELERITAQMAQLSRQLSEREVAEMNRQQLTAGERQQIAERYASQLAASQAERDRLMAHASGLEEQLKHAHDALAESKERAARQREAHATAEDSLRRELHSCHRRLLQRTEQLCRFGDEVGHGCKAADGGFGEALLLAAKELHAQVTKASEEHRCVVCLEGERNAVLLPCRHAVLCQECAGLTQATSGRCPVCRHGISEVMPIFR